MGPLSAVTIHSTSYVDTEDFVGPLRSIFDGAMAFILRNLRKEQASGGVNSPGVPEIPPSVFEELLVNALVHRDYLISAPIRLFLFDDRIEIVRPGHLPNNLTVERIRIGISNIRNPILISYVAKGLLPYRGLGSGIKRALEDWPDIAFTDDRDGCQFTATVGRKNMGEGHLGPSRGTSEAAQKSSLKSSLKILLLMRETPEISSLAIASALGISDRAVKKQIAKLKAEGRIKRIGPDKGGSWKVLDP